MDRARPRAGLHHRAAAVLRTPQQTDKEVRVEWGVSTRTYALSLPLNRRWGRAAGLLSVAEVLSAIIQHARWTTH